MSRLKLMLKHGVRSCLEYAKSFDLKRARPLSNPALAPHLEFVDLGGHGYAKVRLSALTQRACFRGQLTSSLRPKANRECRHFKSGCAFTAGLPLPRPLFPHLEESRLQASDIL